MPTLQSAYAHRHARWIEGMQLNMEQTNIITRTIESAAGIGFGKVACRGTADNTCKVAAASAVPYGITVLDPTQQGTVVDVYPQYQNVAIMTEGVVVAMAGEAVSDGDPVYFVPATGVLMKTSTDNIAIPNAVWDTSTAGPGLAAIRLRG